MWEGDEMTNNEFPFGYKKKIHRNGIAVEAYVYDPSGQQICWKWFYNGFDSDWVIKRYFKQAHKWCDKAINTAHKHTR